MKSKNEEVWIAGNKFKNQKEASKVSGLSWMIGGIFFAGMSYIAGLNFGIWIGVIIAIIGLIGAIGSGK